MSEIHTAMAVKCSVFRKQISRLDRHDAGRLPRLTAKSIAVILDVSRVSDTYENVISRASLASQVKSAPHIPFVVWPSTYLVSNVHVFLSTV